MNARMHSQAVGLVGQKQPDADGEAEQEAEEHTDWEHLNLHDPFAHLSRTAAAEEGFGLQALGRLEKALAKWGLGRWDRVVETSRLADALPDTTPAHLQEVASASLSPSFFCHACSCV